MQQGEWSTFAADGIEAIGEYKDGTKWAGEFLVREKLDSSRGWIETDEEIGDEEKVFKASCWIWIIVTTSMILLRQKFRTI